MATITSYPTEITGSPGSPVTFTGVFPGRENHTVYLGADRLVKAYSGRPGTPTTVIPTDTTIDFYMPKIDFGVADSLDVEFIVENDATGAGASVTVKVLKPQFSSKVFEIRKLWAPNFRLGPRDMKDLQVI